MANFETVSSSTPATSISHVAAAVGAAYSSSASSAPKTIEIQCTVAYPQLSTPDEKTGMFSLLAIVKDESSQQALIDLVGNAAESTFNRRELTGGMHNPLRDSNEKNDAGEYAFKHPVFREDAMVSRLKTKFPPPCVWGPSETKIDASEISGGDECVLEVSAYGYDNKSKGIGLNLGRIWLINKGKVKIERGTGGGNVQRLDRSNLRFTQVEVDTEADVA